MFERRSQHDDRRGPRTRVRARLRRHGVIPRPAELRRMLRANDVRFTSGNALAFYQDGESGLRAMLATIREAELRIHLETYILRSDETGRLFMNALAPLIGRVSKARVYGTEPKGWRAWWT